MTSAVPIVKVQVLVTDAEHAPDQLPNVVAVEDGVAVSVTDVPLSNREEQAAPQLMPAGLLVMVPPDPAVTLTRNEAGMKLADTGVAALIVTTQVREVPEHPPPLQPANTDAADAGAAVSVTTVPGVKFAEHAAPQLMPPTSLVTVPSEVAELLTVNGTGAAVENVAIADCAAVPMLRVQVDVPEHAPDHPANTEAGEEGVAVSVTDVPLLKAALHVEPQLIPAGELETVPLPVPASEMFTAYAAGMKSALTACAEFNVTVHVPTPLQPPPLHPAKTDAADDGVAVSVVVAPCV